MGFIQLTDALNGLTTFRVPGGKMGGVDDHSEFESDGTMKMVGDGTVWLDSMVPPTVFRTGGTALTLAELVGGVYAHRFDVTDVIHFDLQFNHGIKLNSKIYPHVHLVNKDAIVGAANVTFTLNWTWANIESSFPAVTPDSNVVVSYADADALTHKVLTFDEITPVAGQGGISSILVGSLTRVNTGYTTNNIFLLGFDIHYENDTIGSREEFVK
jgi:hypothetical protein